MDGNEITDQEKILARIKEFYELLYTSKAPVGIIPEIEETVPDILISEVKQAIKDTAKDKAALDQMTYT